jgi:hypothetical protein
MPLCNSVPPPLPHFAQSIQSKYFKSGLRVQFIRKVLILERCFPQSTQKPMLSSGRRAKGWLGRGVAPCFYYTSCVKPTRSATPQLSRSFSLHHRSWQIYFFFRRARRLGMFFAVMSSIRQPVGVFNSVKVTLPGSCTIRNVASAFNLSGPAPESVIDCTFSSPGFPGSWQSQIGSQSSFPTSPGWPF